MQRLLLLSLLAVAGCASNTAGKSSSTTSKANTAPDPEGVCNDEVISARGSVGTHCYTKAQLDAQRRFSTDTKLDPAPRQTYNN
jgi:hypothetical protein